MNNIFKSFFKTYLKNWYQALAFIIFILISVALTIGFISNSLQVNILAQRIEKQTKKWDYEYWNYFPVFDDNYFYNYFQNEHGVTNDLNENLLKLDAEVNLDTNDHHHFDTLIEYLDYAYDNYQKNLFDNNYEKYLGNFIRNKVFSFSYLYFRQVLLPKYAENAEDLVVNFHNIINEQWKMLTPKLHGQVEILVDQYLARKYNELNPNDKIFFDSSYSVEYQWKNPQWGSADVIYHLEPINFLSSDNVVTSLSQFKLSQMQDNEVLINDKFAQKHHLKIGDLIKINDFITKENDTDLPNNPLFNHEYKIIGYGTKISNLFSLDQLKNSNQVKTEEGFIYLTDEEMTNYLSYFWYYDNRIISPDGKQKVLEKMPTGSDRIRVESRQSIAKFNQFVADKLHAREHLRIDSAWSNFSFVKIFRFYVLESIIFILIGSFALILTLAFVNYCIKKELKQIASQIGLFKSMGYENRQLASVLWIRTLSTLLIGFACGYLVSWPIQIFVNHLLIADSFSVIVQAVWLNPIFLVLIFLLVPFTLSLINLISITRYLAMNSLFMLEMNGNTLIEKEGFSAFWWYKHQWKNPRLTFIQPFSLQQLVKYSVMPLVFILGILIILIEFNAKTLITDYLNFNKNTYNQKIDHFFSLNKDLKWTFNEQTQKYDFENADEFNLKYHFYENSSGLLAYQDFNLNQLFTEYFALDRTGPTAKQEIESKIMAIINQDINYDTLNLNDFIEFLNFLVNDYEQFLKTDFPNLEPTVEIIKSQWINNFQELNKHLITPNVQLTFNNVFLQKQREVSMLRFKLWNEGWEYPTTENWYLNFLTNENKNVFVMKKYDQLIASGQNQYPAKTLPVIVTDHFAILNGLSIGDQFSNPLTRNAKASIMNFEIVGIDDADKNTNNIYASYDYFKSKMLGVGQQIAQFYNSVFSNNQLLSFKQDQSNFQIQSDYFNFFYPTLNQELNLSEIFSNLSSLANFINWNNINDDEHFESMTLEKISSDNKNQEFKNLITILLLFSLVVILMLFVTIALINVVDHRHEIIILKAFGYPNQRINFKLFWKYLVSIIVGIVGAILISYFLWEALIKLLVKGKILLISPFNSDSIILTSVIMLIIFLIGWIISWIIIKHIQPIPK